MTVIEDIDHSPIGASSMSRWSACPGSVPLSKGMPNNTSRYAAEGTVAHSIAEKWLSAKIAHAALPEGMCEGIEILPPDIWDEVGKSYIAEGFEFEVNDEMVEAVEIYTGVIQDTLAEYSLPWQYVRVENGFALKHIDEEAYGTCDTVIYVPMNRLVVVDFKFGKGVSVSIEWNLQLLYYALGAYYELSESDRADLAYIEIVIVQPRDKTGDTIRRAVYRIPDLHRFENELVAAVARIRAGDDTLAAGSHCKFCPAKPICPEHRKYLNTLAAIDFSQVELEAPAMPKISALSVEQLAVLMDNAKIIKDWCSAVLDHAHSMAERGQNIPGYELVEKQGNRRWVDEAATIAHYEPQLGDDIYIKKVKSPAQLEKLLDKQGQKDLENFWEKPITGKTLVKQGSGRKKALPDIAKDFQVFTQNDPLGIAGGV